ncbi:TIGR03086 family metal-binding protein [Actinomadura luteofluorescens]|uniref:TIGR03086 family metal-binding protein n=1 Tax=Actinomadura luteofluorescens TaxID=46163 RepID=UPI002164E8B2|nr:TIGR03086 family metal-binding protein [Actinomadura glauciflava]MCR3745478.1 TIGR03086 family protein [Actinomadura glauciflava]
MTSMPDLGPAARRMAGLLADVRDSQLTGPTPAEGMPLGALIDHVDGLTLAFTWAAAKDFPDGPSQPPSADAARLAPGWRARVPERLDALAAAWRSPDAWQGMTQAGGIDLPSDQAGHVAMNELVVHGWDVSRALGRPYDAGADEIEACLAFVAPSVEQSGGKGVPGLFGPAVEVGADASALDRLIAMTGRDPSWTAERP